MLAASRCYTKRLLALTLITLIGLWLAFGLTSIPISSHALLVIETCLDITSIILGFMAFVITWYGAGQNRGLRITVIGLVLLTSSILDFANILSYLNCTLESVVTSHLWLTYRFFARMTFVVGLLYAVCITKNSAPTYFSYRSLLAITSIFTVALILNLTYNHNDWFLVKDDQLETVAMLAQYLYCILSCISLYIVRKQNHTDRPGVFLQLSLIFAFLTDLSFAVSGSSPFALNLSGLFFKSLSYYFILKAAFIVVIEEPYQASLQIQNEMRILAEKNQTIFKHHEENYLLLEDILAKLGMIMSSQLNLKDTLAAIVDMIADVMQAPQSLIALKEHVNCTLQVVSTYGINTPPQTIPLNSSLAGKVMEEKIAFSIGNLTEHPELFRPKLIFSEINSLISAPLLNDHQVIGVIEVYSTKKDAFDDKSIQLLTALGHHAGAAIFSAKLYEETKLMLDEEKHLFHIAQITSSTIDNKTILEESLKHTTKILQADWALGFLENETKQFELLISLGFDLTQYTLAINGYPTFENLLQKVKPTLVTADTLPFKNELCSTCHKNKYLLIPLASGQKLLGFLVLGWNKTSPDRKIHLDFLALLAQQIALGIEKANLYNQVKAMALLDGLTGLANRRSYDTFLQTEIQRAQLHQKPLSLIMMDLDKFKVFNDTYGHLTGDKLLKKIGQILKTSLRKADIPARYGGEEFSIILPECTHDTAVNLAETVRKTIEQADFLDQFDVPTAHITASLGVITYDPTIVPTNPLPAELIAAADKALYTAKQTGRNKVVNCLL